MSEPTRKELTRDLNEARTKLKQVCQENIDLSENYKTIEKSYQSMMQKYGDEKDRNDKIREHQEHLNQSLQDSNAIIEELRAKLYNLKEEHENNRLFELQMKEESKARIVVAKQILEDAINQRVY